MKRTIDQAVLHRGALERMVLMRAEAEGGVNPSLGACHRGRHLSRRKPDAASDIGSRRTAAEYTAIHGRGTPRLFPA